MNEEELRQALDRLEKSEALKAGRDYIKELAKEIASVQPIRLLPGTLDGWWGVKWFIKEDKG